MIWVIWILLVLAVSGCMLLRLFIDGVVDLVREKRDRS